MRDIVGIIYYLLLRGNETSLNTTLPWVNFILHYLFPVYIVADWFIGPLAHWLDFRRALVWLAFPVLYLVYSLLRGPIVNWYPYPFLNPDTGGSGAIITVSIGITLLSLLLTYTLARKKPAAANS